MNHVGGSALIHSYFSATEFSSPLKHFHFVNEENEKNGKVHSMMICEAVSGDEFTEMCVFIRFISQERKEEEAKSVWMRVIHKTTIFVTTKGRMSAEKCWMFFFSFSTHLHHHIEGNVFLLNFAAAASGASQLICSFEFVEIMGTDSAGKERLK